MNKQPWDNLMLRREKVAGWIYLPIHVILLPLLMGVVMYAITGEEPDGVLLNLIYYGIGLVVILASMWSFLKVSYRRVTENILRFFGVLLGAYAISMLLTLIYGALTEMLGTPPSPNQDLVEEIAVGNMNRMFAMAVLMVPIVEECLFRGLIFGTIRDKNRVLAYVIGILAFSLYHVWQYAVAYHDWTLLLGAIQYIPISAALCYAYDRSGTIWAPIFLHMLNNAISLSLTNQ